MAKTNTEAPARGRGRPKLPISIKTEQALTNEGYARVTFGEGRTPLNARMILYNSAARAGVTVATRRLRHKGRDYMEARVKDSEVTS